MRVLAIGLMLLTGCTSTSHFETENEKVVALERALRTAEEKRDAYIEQAKALARELSKERLIDIRKRVHAYRRKVTQMDKEGKAFRRVVEEELPALFREEREQLTKIIDEGSDFDQEAQSVLDDILSLITELNQFKSE